MMRLAREGQRKKTCPRNTSGSLLAQWVQGPRVAMGFLSLAWVRGARRM